MKKAILISAAIIAYHILHTTCCFSQGTAINTTGSAADSSAMLDVSSTSKGQLIPRMTTAQRNGITSPANSLLIFNTDVNCLQIYINTVWQNIYCDLGCTDSPAIPGSISGNDSPCQNSTGISYSVAQVAGATSYNWSAPAGATIIAGQGTVGIVVNFGTSSGSITVTANNSCGVSAPQSLTITTASTPSQPEAISGNTTPCAGATGLTYSVTNVAGINYNWTLPTGGSPLWAQTGGGTTNSITATAGSASGDITVTPSNACGSGTAQTLAVAPESGPGTPSAGTHTSSQTQIIWNWNSVAGATGYKWHTANDYNSAQDMGTNLSYTENNLTCNTPYTRYIWAYNTCGGSTPLSTADTTTECKQVFSFTGSTQTFGVPTGITSITVKAWGGGGGGHDFTAENGPGAGAGFSQATLSVTPGEDLTVYVGGGGGHGFDYPGRYAAGGGGGSGIKRGGTILLVAGGGGGNSNYGQSPNGGVGGGTNGGTGNGGTGGTQTAAGVHGGSGNQPGSDGNGNNGGKGGTYNSQSGGSGGFGLGYGGDGGSFNAAPNGCGGGGGGGGYYGGGGGNGDTSGGGQTGGGGSGYVSGTATYTVSGTGQNAGNDTDSDYGSNAGRGGNPYPSVEDGYAGRVVISW